jgi:ribosomal protein S12 methylthiotransferase
MKSNSPLMKKRIAIITNNLHCERHIQYFSTIEKYLKSNGWEIAENFNVHKIIICGCGFHDAMYEKVKRTLREIRETNFLEKNIIILACLTKTHEMDLKKHFKGEIVEFHREELLDRIVSARITFKEIRLVNMYKIHEKCCSENKINENFYIKISEGCLRECTFCVINKAKGYIGSVPFDKIVGQVKTAIEYGRKNIFLMGEDTFAYGIDIGTNIIELIEKLIARYPFIDLYFGYLHIRWLRKYSEKILSLCKRRILKELHIGLQHINNEMLKSMGRPQVFSRIYDIICKIKKECPEIYMVADILIGFPGETDEMFDQLVEFFKKDKCFNKVKHFGYSDVKGALSFKLDQKVPPDAITSRWEILDKVLGKRSYSYQSRESRLDDETFRVTRFDDYSFCKDTFDEMLQGSFSAELAVSGSNILNQDKEDFEF